MFNQINDSPQSGIAPHDFYAKILYGKSPEKYGFVLGVTMGRVLVFDTSGNDLIQSKRKTYEFLQGSDIPSRPYA